MEFDFPEEMAENKQGFYLIASIKIIVRFTASGDVSQERCFTVLGVIFSTLSEIFHWIINTSSFLMQ